MTQENGYFQIELSNGASILHIFPPMGSGEPADFDEIVRYLNARGYSELPLREIKENICYSNEVRKVNLGCFDGLEISGDMSTKVSLDKMVVTARFYPPSLRGNALDVDDVINDLRNKGIVYGVDTNAVSMAIRQKIYCTDFVIAKGDAPDHGKDAKITYFFNTDLSIKPKANDDGSVDFHSLDTISHVFEDQLIARLTPAGKGKAGKDVCGKEVKQRIAKDLVLQSGANSRLSENGLELFSTVNGHATVVDGKIFVSKELEIPANVDNSTGDIDYNGSVYIRGNICEGFTVIADGDIVVDGVIEGANIACGGQVIIRRGIQGQGRVSIKAESNVICKYIENAVVESGGYIETDSIINSNVSASGDVIVKGKNGLIIGGIIRAGGKIDARTVGTEMGSTSRLEVGVDPAKKTRFIELQNTIKSTNTELMKLEPVLSTYKRAIDSGKELNEKQATYYQYLLTQVKSLKNTLQSSQQELMVIQQTILRSNNSKVVIQKDIYPGTIVTISELTMRVLSKRSFCQFRKKLGEIEVSNL